MFINQTSLLIYIRLGGVGAGMAKGIGVGLVSLAAEDTARGRRPPRYQVFLTPGLPCGPFRSPETPDTGPPLGRAVAGNRAWRRIQRFTEPPDAHPRPSSPGPPPGPTLTAPHIQATCGLQPHPVCLSGKLHIFHQIGRAHV